MVSSTRGWRPSTSSPLYERARQREERIRVLNRCREHDRVLMAIELAKTEAAGEHRLLGYASINAYMRQAHGLPASTAVLPCAGEHCDLIQVGRGLERLALVRDAVCKGEITWSHARLVVRVATPEDQAVWLEKAKRLTAEQLALEIAAKDGDGADPVKRRLVLRVDDEQLAWLEDAALAVRKEGGPADLAGALAEACRRGVLGGDGPRLGGPTFRVVIDLCHDCRCARRRTHEGEVTVTPAELERALCDAEVLDMREGPDAEVKRHVPTRTRTYVHERDRGRCQVPGCRNRGWVDLHHEDGWKAGHDANAMVTLCDAHHRERHLGYLRIEGRWPDMRFFLADGTCLGKAGDERRADGPAAPAPPPGPASLTPPASAPADANTSAAADTAAAAADTAAAPANTAAVANTAAAPANTAAVADVARAAPTREVVEVARRALVGLEFKAREAKALLKAVIEGEPGRTWQPEDLVRQCLLLLPPPRARTG